MTPPTPHDGAAGEPEYVRQFALLKTQLTPENWTSGDEAQYFGFFLHGWFARSGEAAFQQAPNPSGAPTSEALPPNEAIIRCRLSELPQWRPKVGYLGPYDEEADTAPSSPVAAETVTQETKFGFTRAEVRAAIRERDELRAKLSRICEMTEGYADGAHDATAHDRLCNEISAIAHPTL